MKPKTTDSGATKAYFRRADTVRTWWFPERTDDPLFEHFQEQLRWLTSQVGWSGRSVLDIATGKGRCAVVYGVHGARVTAFDISSEMLSDAQAAAAGAHLPVRFGLADAEVLPFRSAAFDVVSCVEAIMHFPRPVVALREMARVVKPGGVVLLSMTNRLCVSALVRWPDRALSRLRSGRSSEPRTFWTYTLWEFTRLLHEAGLAPEKPHGQGLLQAARIPLGRGRFLPVVPRPLADWSFAHLEPRLRETPLLALMGTIMFVCRPVEAGRG